jgi:hypothetical protein
MSQGVATHFKALQIKELNSMRKVAKDGKFSNLFI